MPADLARSAPKDPRRFALPIQELIATEAASGVLLLAVTLAALLWANSPWHESYSWLRNLPVSVRIGDGGLEKPLYLWVNDLLMAVFFFLVGLEIKRELLVGELRGWHQASLPLFAGLGGMAVPAAIYSAVNAGTPTAGGWGVPMATDIAFALGVLSLLGSRVPPQLSVFLLALAIIDDLGAVLVIALFYTGNLETTPLLLAGLVWLLAFAYGRSGGGRAGIYAVLGILLWGFVLRSGVHATLAGIALAATVPIAHRVDLAALRAELRSKMGGSFEEIEMGIGRAAEVLLEARSPLHRFEHALAPWVAFLIVPLFALLNAGVKLPSEIGTAIASPVTTGVFLGLLFGKPLGIVGACLLADRLAIARMPEWGNLRQLAGVGLLAGIGFTMALFIGHLAFGEGSALDEAKLGILAASLLAAVTGALLLAIPAGAGPTGGRDRQLSRGAATTSDRPLGR